MIRRRKPRFYPGEFSDILRLLLSGGFLKGPCVGQFEKEVAGYIGCKHAAATCSGRNGLDLILDAYGIGPGDEVLVPAYTLKDLILLLRSKGIVPRLVDIESDSFNIDPAKLEERRTPKTKAVLATHLFGSACRIQEVVRFARAHGLVVIEDCAHGLGAETGGKKVGAFGDAGFLSFELIKPVNTFGGGMVVTDDPRVHAFVKAKTAGYPLGGRGLALKMAVDLFEHALISSPLFPPLMRLFANPLAAKALSRIYLSLQSQTRLEYSRYANVQAQLGLAQMKVLDQRNDIRISAAHEISERLHQGILPQAVAPGDRHIYYFYVAKIPSGLDLEQVRDQLRRKGVDAGIRFEITDDCTLLVGSEADCPTTKEVSRRAIQLPIYDGLDSVGIGLIARALNAACAECLPVISSPS